jgi:hypothetical protein
MSHGSAGSPERIALLGRDGSQNALFPIVVGQRISALTDDAREGGGLVLIGAALAGFEASVRMLRGMDFGVNVLSEMTRFDHLALTRPCDGKALRRAATK